MAGETTPLLAESRVVPAQAPEDAPVPVPARKGFMNPHQRVLFTSFLLSLSFAFTQTPLIYAVRLMTCADYWAAHPGAPAPSGADRCAVKEIEATTAQNVALMSTMTTSSTIVNLFVTGYIIRRWGVKAGMSQQTFWAAFRNVTQIIALGIGGNTGIRIIQTTQLFNILGGAGGYILCANAYVPELVAPADRTGAFGQQQGVVMLARAVGFTAGGLVSDWFDISAPFKVTFCLLVGSTLFSFAFLPYVPPAARAGARDAGEGEGGPVAKRESAWAFLAPMKVFFPAKVYTPDGRYEGRKWGLMCLGLGEFLAVFATGFVPMMLQLIATNLYGFLPTENGLMMSLQFLVRACFLSLLFPRIIQAGRRWIAPQPAARAVTPAPAPPPKPTASPDAHTQLAEFEPRAEADGPEEEHWEAPTDVVHGSTFDLRFLQASIALDGVLTACCVRAREGWHIYLAAFVLPFASGTAPASKGTIMELVEPAQRADALNAIALIERFATIAGIGVFGNIFALVSERGVPTYVFLCNACVAFLGAIVLSFVRLPKKTAPARGPAAL